MRVSMTYRGCLLTLASTLVTMVALAHSGATGVVKDRMQGMKAMSDATKALGAMKAGAIPFSVETLRLAVDEIARHGVEAKDQFPEGSLVSPSEALPVIWMEKAAFDKVFDEMIAAADQVKTVENLEAAIPLITRIGDQCKDCHSRYRIRK